MVNRRKLLNPGDTGIRHQLQVIGCTSLTAMNPAEAGTARSTSMNGSTGTTCFPISPYKKYTIWTNNEFKKSGLPCK